MYESLIMSKTKGKKMVGNKIPVSGSCQLSKFKKHMGREVETILQELTELNAKNHNLTSVSYGLVMEKDLCLRVGSCQFSEFEKHMNRGIETILQKLTEINAKSHNLPSVSYELTVEFE